MGIVKIKIKIDVFRSFGAKNFYGYSNEGRCFQDISLVRKEFLKALALRNANSATADNRVVVKAVVSRLARLVVKNGVELGIFILPNLASVWNFS